MFKVNQPVWCVVYGAGVIESIDQEDTYPINVKFKNSTISATYIISTAYTLDGKYHEAGNVTLFPYPVEVVKATTKPSIDWTHVNEHYKYLAMDEGGLHHLFTEKPIQVASEWRTNHPYVFAGHFASLTLGTCDWKDSLIERPKN